MVIMILRQSVQAEAASFIRKTHLEISQQVKEPLINLSDTQDLPPVNYQLV